MANVNETIGKCIKQLRMDSGVSQEQLAERAGVHRTYVSQLERGIKSPTLIVLTKIAKALGTRPSHILRLVETKLD